MPQPDPIQSDQPDDTAPIIELAADTLRGDVRDSILGWIKALPKAWPFMNEAEKRDVADAADRFSYELTKQACGIIASRERPCVVATLKEYREKDGVEAKLKLASTENVITNLHQACGQEVLVVTSGFDLFKGEAGPAEVEPDPPAQGDFIGEEYQNQ